ncbi:trna delta -isopentenylpyrophosphate transferase [Methylobacterium sp. JK268]
MGAESDKQIAEILATYGEPLAGNVWRVQGTAVIYHKALERIAAQARIRFDAPVLVRAERDEAVILVTGHMPSPSGERTEWSIGEALIGMNYRVSGKQAAYVYAMAEKRGKDRVILKLVGLHGLLYSEDEADEFKEANADAQERRQASTANRPPSERNRKDADFDEGPAAIEVGLKADIDKAKTINAVTDLMLDPETQQRLACLAPGIRDGVREYARDRLVALGWPAKRRRPEAAE